MTREEELNILNQYIDEHGVIKLPPDERGPEMFKTVWTKSKKKYKNKKTKKAQPELVKEKT